MMSVKYDSMIPESIHCHVNGNGVRRMSQVQKFVTKKPILEQHISPHAHIGRYIMAEYT